MDAQELAALPLFEGESREALKWIASCMVVRSFEPGETILRPGDAVTDFQLVLDGEVHLQLQGDPHASAFVRAAGSVFGVLPFSRMKVSPARGWAVRPTRIAYMDASHLRELVYRAPILAQKLVSEMTDRTRAIVRSEEGSSRLLALGKLAAGLAHELNNPASAAVRSAARLREVLAERRDLGMAFRVEDIPASAREVVYDLTQTIVGCVDSTPGTLDALERADRESDLADWLDGVGVPGELAGGLVDAGISMSQLQPMVPMLTPRALTLGLRLTVADHEMFCLTREVEEAARRISDLVQAVKTYSYMDQSPVAEVDVEQGIDVTLRMFQHQLKHGVQVLREFDGNLPRIRANGGALNQIWTNLIDNAIAAMESLAPGEPKVLRVRTCTEPGGILVEVADNGPGIPEAAQSRIFEPFFTTKAVGEGSGLGLDIVHRIVRNHNGSIRVDSIPGRTVFQVRLPR